MITGFTLYHYHLTKDQSPSAYIGLVASFLMSFIGVINGSTDVVRIVHSVITLGSFVLYGAYCYLRGADKRYVFAAAVVLLVRYIHLASLINWKGVMEDPWNIKQFVKEAVLTPTIGVIQFRGACQWIVISLLAYMVLSLIDEKRNAKLH